MVPDPQKGSRAHPPTGQVFFMIRSNSFRGFVDNIILLTSADKVYIIQGALITAWTR